MPVLTIWQNGTPARFPFQAPARLCDALEAAGFLTAHPCGGRGVCGKCAVTLTGDVSAPNDAETHAGARLTCQAMLFGDAQVTLPEVKGDSRIETDGEARVDSLRPLPKTLGAAVDIGTTTLALRLYDPKTGRCAGEAASLNPQRSVAADVMGRIGAALAGAGEKLRRQVLDGVDSLIAQACAKAERNPSDVDALVVAGNTTMLYLLTGKSPEALSHAPFEADCLFDETAPLWGGEAYLPPCMNAFVGADITCAVLASGLCDHTQTALLCDIGTNGEIALWKDGRLYVASTAAGPAYEGAGISCGSGSVPGAIDRVWIRDANIAVHALDDARPASLCGSGLIDAVAAFLELGWVDETGRAETEALPLAGNVALLPKDIRALQLAKAAIAAGVDTLMEHAGVSESEIGAFYIAGGFGSHLNVQSAARIGLIPSSLTDRVRVLGNAALAGASMMLLDKTKMERARAIARRAVHVPLGGNPRFSERYMEQMMFPEEE